MMRPSRRRFLRGGLAVAGLGLLSGAPSFRALAVRQAAEQRVPTIYPTRDAVAAGRLMAYGPNLPDLFRRAAGYVDKILKGAKPADLPVERPSRLDFVINLKAAQALGLSFPETVRLQVTEWLQ